MLVNISQLQTYDLALIIGFSIILTVVMYYLVNYVSVRVSLSEANLDALKYKSKIFRGNIIDKTKVERLKDSFKKKEEVTPSTIGALIGTLFIITLVPFKGVGFSNYMLFIAFGVGLGLIIGKLVEKIKKDKIYNAKVRELALISELIELFSMSGYQLNTILSLAIPLLSHIRPEVERCIARWPSGVDKALYALEKELNMEEAAVLVSVLVHANNIGVEYAKQVLQEESRNLELIRKTLVELKIASKPIYYSVYRVIPFAAAIAMGIVPLVYNILDILKILIG